MVTPINLPLAELTDFNQLHIVVCFSSSCNNIQDQCPIIRYLWCAIFVFIFVLQAGTWTSGCRVFSLYPISSTGLRCATRNTPFCPPCPTSLAVPNKCVRSFWDTACETKSWSCDGSSQSGRLDSVGDSRHTRIQPMCQAFWFVRYITPRLRTLWTHHTRAQRISVYVSSLPLLSMTQVMTPQRVQTKGVMTLATSCSVEWTWTVRTASWWRAIDANDILDQAMKTVHVCESLTLQSRPLHKDFLLFCGVPGLPVRVDGVVASCLQHILFLSLSAGLAPCLQHILFLSLSAGLAPWGQCCVRASLCWGQNCRTWLCRAHQRRADGD